MKKLLFLLLFLPFVTSGQTVLLGYKYRIQQTATMPTVAQLDVLKWEVLSDVRVSTVVFKGGDPLKDKYMVVAFPSSKLHTGYTISPLDFGQLGAGGTFTKPVRVGNYNVIISNYPTYIPTPVTFK